MKAPKKTWLKRILGSSIITLIGLVVFAYIFMSFGREYIRRYQVNKEIDRLQKEVEKMEGENLKFVELTDYLNSNQFIEKEARDKLGYGKTGENSVIIEKDSQTNNSLVEQADGSTAKVAENIKALPNPNKWWFYFFNNY